MISPRIIFILVFLFLLLPGLAAQPSPTPSAVPARPADIPSTAQRFSLLIMDNLAGQQAVWTASDGTLHAFFQFNDRGRGPKTTSIYKLDPNGLPLSETVSGNNYLKSPVDESFAIADGTAHWKNNAEHGEKKISDPAYYYALDGAPIDTGFLVQAALRNGGKITLLPEGEARVQRMTELDIDSSGSPAASHKKRVTLYSISGLDFAPTYVWMEEAKAESRVASAENKKAKAESPEPKAQEFFASVDTWSATIPEGWESAVKPLLDAQEKVKQARAAELAAKLAHRAPGILLRRANVFDPNSGQVVRDQDVLVVGSRIISIEKSKANTPNVQIPVKQDCDKTVIWSECAPISMPGGPTVPPQIIDAHNKTLLPGLWDMHAHVGDNDGLLNLAAGVTTVRDLANDTDSLLARRRRIADGKEIGTRIVIAGIIDGNDAFHGPTKVLVSMEKEARAAVDNYKRLGYVQIKIYSSVPPAIVPAIIDEAHKNGLRVSGHIPAGMTADQCVKLGYDEIQHINFLVLNFFPEIKNTNTIARLTKPGELAASLDLSSAQVQSFIKLLQDHHTKLDLTLNVFEDQYMSRIGQIPPGFQPVASRLPAQVRRGLLTQGMTPPAGLPEGTYEESFAKMIELAGLLYRSGLSIEAGTDSMAGFALERELELDVQAGIPPAQVLQNATLNAARIMNLDQDLGSIAPGKLADLVLVDGDPTKNISDIRKTAVVVKDGVLYYPAELYTELGVAP